MEKDLQFLIKKKKKLFIRRTKDSILTKKRYTKKNLIMSSDALTNTLNPTTSSTITIRIIKNFEYRTVKNLVLQNINLETITIKELKELIRESIY